MKRSVRQLFDCCRAGLVGGVVALVIAGAAVMTVSVQERSQDLEAEEAAVRAAAATRTSLEQALGEQLMAVHALVGYVSAAPDIDGRAFEDFAARLEDDLGMPARAIQLAPDGVVSFVHPLEGNEEAVGHDLLADPERRDAVQRAIDERRTVMAGPFELLQGGVGVINRRPVYVPTGAGRDRFWGLAITVLDFDRIVVDAGLAELGEAGFTFALRGKDGLGADGEVFLGDPELFSRAAATTTVSFDGGSWVLAVAPARSGIGWPLAPFVLGGGFLLALVLAWVVTRWFEATFAAADASAERDQILDAVHAPIVALDREGRVLHWNRAAATLVGVDREEGTGRSLWDPDGGGLVPPDRVTLPMEATGAGLSTELLVEQEVALRDAAGRQHDLLVHAAPLRDGRGEDVGAVLVGQDVTARREVEDVRARNVAMARSARLKDEFLASMSHELRTPLNGVIGLSTVLAKETFGELNERQTEYVGQIRSSGEHLLELINDVLDLAKIEAHRQELDVRGCDLRAITREAVRMIQESARSRELTVAVSLPDQAVEMQGDPRRLRQVLVNLLSNAVKFTDVGGRVGITLSVDGAGITWEVSDTGIGIAARDLDLLFVPFQQLDGSLDRAHGGTGLGLALTKRLVDLHDGEITVDSTVGKGSTFRVHLPGTPVVCPVNDDAEPAPTADPAVSVLVVEDQDINRRLLADYLDAQGYRVRTAEDGVVAVASAVEDPPDVILMDVQLPRQDGLSATRALKAEPRTAGVPIIALTALAMAGDEQRCLDAGCDGYLTKPYHPDDVVAAVVDATCQEGC